MSLLDEKVKQFRELLDQTLEQFTLMIGFAGVKAGSQTIATDEQLRKIFVATVKQGIKCSIPAERVGEEVWNNLKPSHQEHVSNIIWKNGPFNPQTYEWVRKALIQVCQDTKENVLEVRREITQLQHDAEGVRKANLSGSNQGLPGS